MHSNKKLLYTSLAIMAVAVFALGKLGTDAAGVMTGGDYVMELDSVNDGGVDSQGGDYDLEDTIGEMGTGYSDDDQGDPNLGSPTYSMDVAGFQQILGAGYITMEAISDVNMGSNIPGMTGGESIGTTDPFDVTTADTSGHEVFVKATTSPALKCDDGVGVGCDEGSDAFADYTIADIVGPVYDPDYDWTLGAGASEFGFSVTSDDTSHINQLFLNDGSSACNSGANSSLDNCWYGLNNTTGTKIVDKTTEGTTNNIRLRFKAAVSNSGGFQVEGQYKATIIITAVTK